MKIFVKAKPNSKDEKVEKINENNYIISVKEPPIRGLANKTIIKVLAEYFNVSQSRVLIVSGFTSKNKIIEIHPVK